MSSIRVWIAAAFVAGVTWASTPGSTPGSTPQSAAPRPHATTTPASKKAATRPKLTDAQLEAAIRAKFAKSKINTDRFTVKVQGGIATIDGKTDVVQHKGTATRMARTAGATVNNRVQVSDAAKQKAAGNLETGRRRAQVTRGDPRSSH
jgi:hypothetical protein